jgi:Domain of unknown function (DUF4260)
MNAGSGSVRRWLRLEGLAVLFAALFLYHAQGGSWLLFAVLFLAPDLSMLGYLANAHVGAIAYNIIHSYVLPLVLLGVAVLTRSHIAAECGLIWVAHIGLDRLLGYGLKYPTAFGETHLGKIGKQRFTGTL